MVFGLILAIFVICSIFSSFFLVSYSSIAVLRFFWASIYSVRAFCFFSVRFSLVFFLVWHFLFLSDLFGFFYFCIVWFGLFVLIFVFLTVFFIISMIFFSRSGYFLFLSFSSLVFICLLKLSHPSLLFRFHFSMMVFFLGRLVAIVVIMVLWSVSVFPFTLSRPSSSTIVDMGLLMPLDVSM